MKESNMPKADFLMSNVLILFGIFVMILSSQMPDLANQNASPYSAPGVVPFILGIIFSFLGIVMLIRSIIRKGYIIKITGVEIKAWFKDLSTRRFLMTLLISVGYAMILLGRVHYLLATGIYMFLFVFMFEFKKGVGILKQKKTFFMALLLAVITSGSVYWVFRYLFLVNLPG
jgi:putative tricarboxylic transport membrane protein